jgi:hypothetical protein
MRYFAFCLLVAVESCSSAPETAPAETSACGTSGPESLRRLTGEEYAHAVTALLALPPPRAMSSFPVDDKEASFDANRTPATPLGVNAYHLAARELADGRTAWAQWAGCSNAACLTQWLPQFLLKAWRRPATVEEVDMLTPLLAQGPLDEATRSVVEIVLQSPSFLYHLEASESSRAYAVAARLASLLWASIPDDELLAAAKSGALLSPSGRRQQAERMLADAQAIEGLGSFHQQWLEVDALPTLEKEAAEWSTSVAEGLLDEVSQFSAFFIRRGDGRLKTLLQMPVAFAPSPAMEATYGLTGAQGEAPTAAPGRSGLLTTGAFLATHAHRDQTSPVKRGFVVRDRFFCQKPTPPPPSVNNAPPALDPSATTKERFAAHTADPACAGCHAITDPIGWGLEGFDSVGKRRAVEAGRPVDDRGELTGTDVDGSFVGASGLAEKLAASALVQDCVTTQWVRFALRREENEIERCQLDALKSVFRSSGGNVRTLLLNLAESSLLVSEGL